MIRLTLCGRIFSSSSPLRPLASSSFLASSVVLPFIRASVWARKLASRIYSHVKHTHTHTRSDTVCFYSEWCTEDVSMVSVCWTPTCWHINRCLSDSDAIFNIFSPCFCLRGFCVFYLSWLLWWTNMWHLRKITQKSVFRSKITC